jgi:hypothetical protein
MSQTSSGRVSTVQSSAAHRGDRAVDHLGDVRGLQQVDRDERGRSARLLHQIDGLLARHLVAVGDGHVLGARSGHLDGDPSPHALRRTCDEYPLANHPSASQPENVLG